ncbi:MAG: rRNA maturation RNase YbeY [Pseudomonadota bacterium]|nr:rRNA maturation RNase YbeY [Pseudomonadota bacterium]
MKTRVRIPKFREGVIRKEAKLKLTTQYAIHPGGVPIRPQFRKWVKAALMQDAEIVLRIVDETEGLSLNRDFRGRDYATNVLTFVYSNVRPLSGDIVLCAPVVEKEARQQHKNLTAHYAHLMVHGVLHLQGYDHGNDTAAAVMEQLETQIMIRLGHNDPYAEYQLAMEES